MGNLHLVGTTLSAEAKKSGGDIADAFGRSAFNRYYYAAYLEVRDLLVKFKSDWDIKHAKAPEYLEENLQEIFRREIKRQVRIQLLTCADGKKIASTVSSSGSAIAQVLRVAYKVRVISDYLPDEPVMFDQATFHLDSHSEGEAKAWLRTVETHKGRILKYGKELELV